MHDKKHRNRLMDAVHEADNLIDHFGQAGRQGGDPCLDRSLLTRRRGAARYNALMGKAASLDVRIIPLEEMAFEKLSRSPRQSIQTEKMDAA